MRIVKVTSKKEDNKILEDIMRKTVRFLSAVINMVIIAVCVLVGHYFIRLPNNYYVTKGTSLKLPCYFSVDVFSQSNTVQSLNSKVTPLNSKVTLKLFGVIPIKDVNVQAVDRPVLVPGGNPFGIKLLTEGVMVIGLGEVQSQDGIVSPATDAGIKMGDVVISVNGRKVTSNSEIANIISNCDGQVIPVILKRNSEDMLLNLKPVYSVNDGSYKAGMWVRDSTAGIGTITFYDPATGNFGGLGHPVCDVDTGEILPLSSGEVVDVSINGVSKGISGTPGELLGSFISNVPIGNLLINNQSGLFGKLSNAPNLSSPIPMAMRQEIEVGDATILTTINGGQPKEYKIRIEKIDLKESENSKNMVIRVTDKELLDISGGIVQGMSGSPIIQNGRLVGAVTHVFVNDPTKGYGIFCDTMYSYANSLTANTAQKDAA